MSRGILDTSRLIPLGRLQETDPLRAEPLITAITLAELSVGPLVASTDGERAARQAHVQQSEADFEPLPFDADAARSFGQVAAGLRSAGRKPATRAYDATIAISNDLPLHTCNPRDSTGIDELTVIAVPHPATARCDDRGR